MDDIIYFVHFYRYALIAVSLWILGLLFMRFSPRYIRRQRSRKLINKQINSQRNDTYHNAKLH